VKTKIIWIIRPEQVLTYVFVNTGVELQGRKSDMYKSIHNHPGGVGIKQKGSWEGRSNLRWTVINGDNFQWDQPAMWEWPI